LFSPQIADSTDSTWVNVFNEAGEELFGCKADVLAMEKLESEIEYTNRIKSLLHKEFLFRYVEEN
jgi:hypothetical protein